MSRRPWIGGNWKCNGTIDSLKTLAEELNKAAWNPEQMDVVICPTAVHMALARACLKSEYIIASQNVSATGNGAFTGEISTDILLDLGFTSTLIGHSERRQYYGETNKSVGAKVSRCQAAEGMTAIVCIGETLAEREGDLTEKVLREQLSGFLGSVCEWSRVVIAYEPVWAIGTGKVATPQQAQQAHEVIRAFIAENVSGDVANAVRVVYGGSVTAANCVELAAQPDIDGFLVGGASLKPEFVKIIASMAH